MLFSFTVHGDVQGVMFRKTFTKGCINLGIKAGATNDKSNRNLVKCSVECSEEELNKLKERLLNLEYLNSWNAKVESIEDIEDILISEHEVTTENVDGQNWSTGVEFYF